MEAQNATMKRARGRPPQLGADGEGGDDLRGLALIFRADEGGVIFSSGRAARSNGGC
jgi:hypothetical protein